MVSESDQNQEGGAEEKVRGEGVRGRGGKRVRGGVMINPFTPELKKCILPTFQKAIVWVM